MNFLDILGHFFNVIYIVGLLYKDILKLRILLMVASILELTYNVLFYYKYNDTMSSSELYMEIFWCLVWFGINFVQAYIIIKNRMTLKFNEDEKLLHKTAFAALDELSFKSLMKTAQWKDVKTGDILIQEGTVIHELMVVFDGLLEVVSHGKVIANLRNGNFAGEMSFISGNLTNATVKAVNDTRIILWDKDELRKLMNNNPELQSGMQAVFNSDLITKLNKKND